MKRQRVAYVFPVSHRFRAPFHEHLRRLLDARGVDYDYVHTDAEPGGKGDTIPIAWGTRTRMIPLRLGGVSMEYQTAFKTTWSADLVIIQQENSLLANYPIQVLRRLAGRRVAFFGHGKNFQAANPQSRAERFKRFWIARVDWWFAYTELSADIVASAGFPRERITVFNNAIDTTAIRDQKASITAEDVETLRRERFAGSPNIGVYIGGLYDHKRVPFLIEAARVVRAQVPDFQLVVIGGGPDAHLIQAAAEDEPWIHALGPMFGREKTLMASLGKVFLMPGLVGLGVLDSFAYGMPMVTCALPFHSPEIDYLKDGVNGVMVKDAGSVADYAAAVTRVLTDEPYRAMLTANAAEAITGYTIEAMAERFAEGVMRALASPPRRGRARAA
jgi:glycosyltransferase involved in cell wall biosynthesis